MDVRATGMDGLLLAGSIHLALLVAAVWASGAAKPKSGRARQHLSFLLVWTDMLQLAFVLLAYLSAAAYGAALLKAGWIGKAGGCVFVALNLVATVGIVLAGGGSTFAAGLVFVLTIPFMVFVLPYFMGVVLVRRGSREGAAFEKKPSQPTLLWQDNSRNKER